MVGTSFITIHNLLFNERERASQQFCHPRAKIQQLSLEKFPVPSFIPNFFPQRSSLEARGIFVIGRWEGREGASASPFFDAQTPFRPLSPLDSVALVCPTNRWHYLWRQYYENILGEIVFSNPVSLKHFTRILPLMTAKLSKIGNFSPSCPTSKRDQIPLSNIFSASTSSAL